MFLTHEIMFFSELCEDSNYVKIQACMSSKMLWRVTDWKAIISSFFWLREGSMWVIYIEQDWWKEILWNG
jgi:hypothetical protein